MKLVVVVNALFLQSSLTFVVSNSNWGTEANIEKWPFITYLVYFDGGQAVAGCAGALLSSQTVLTAAHCLDELTGYKLQFSRYHIQIFMGSSNVLTATMIRTVSDYQTHYEYKIAGTYADIGVAFLEKPVSFSKTVKKSLLLPSPPKHSAALVAGWGVWQNTLNKTHKMLYFNKQKLIPYESCKEEIKDFENGQICTGDFKSSHFIFGGDSGGPLVTKEGYQIGLVSYTASNAVTVYTNTSYYYKWISKTQKQLFKKNCAYILDT